MSYNDFSPKYDPKLALQICEKIASTTDRIEKICRDNNFPHHTTLYRWMQDPDKRDFLLAYLFARQAQADILDDEMIAIADNYDPDKDNAVKIARDRLKITARRWKAARLAPKKYNDSLIETAYQENEEPKGNVIVWGKRRIQI